MKVPRDKTHDKLLAGEPRPTGDQLAWVFAHLADCFDSDQGQSYGKVMERMYGFPSEAKVKAIGQGQYVMNIINCARDNPAVRRAVNQCYL